MQYALSRIWKLKQPKKDDDDDLEYIRRWLPCRRGSLITDSRNLRGRIVEVPGEGKRDLVV
jgi:hypothetical protein